MKEPEFLEEEEDFLEESDDAEDDVEGMEDLGDEFDFESEDDDDSYENHSSGQRTKRVNARRALEDYFEEKLRREEESYFDDFSISLDDE